MSSPHRDRGRTSAVRGTREAGATLFGSNHNVDLLDTYSKQEHWLEEFNRILEMPRTGPPQRLRKPKQVQRRLQPDEISDLVAAYKAGATISDLAKRFQIHTITVTAHLQRQAVKPRQRGLTENQIEEAVRTPQPPMSVGQRWTTRIWSFNTRARQPPARGRSHTGRRSGLAEASPHRHLTAPTEVPNPRDSSVHEPRPMSNGP